MMNFFNEMMVLGTLRGPTRAVYRPVPGAPLTQATMCSAASGPPCGVLKG